MAGSSWTNQVQNIVLVGGSANSGVFVYDPSVGAGNLIASMTDALKDPFGDVTVKGVAAYVTAGGILYAVGLNAIQAGNLPGFSIQDTASPPSLPAGVFGEASNSGGVAFVTLFSGKINSGDTQASVAVHSATDSGVTRGQILLLSGKIQLGNSSSLVVNDETNQEAATLTNALVSGPPSTPGTGVSLYAGATGSLSAVNQQGLAGTLPVVQADQSSNSVGNSGTATDLTKTWTIPANDAVAGTRYVIKTFIGMTIGATTAESFTIGVDLNGTKTALATLGASFNSSTLGAAYDIPAELAIEVDANGAGTPQIMLNAVIGNTSANRLSANSAVMSGHSNVLTFTKSSSNTVALYVQFAGAGGTGQQASTLWSKLYREGP